MFQCFAFFGRPACFRSERKHADLPKNAFAGGWSANRKGDHVMTEEARTLTTYPYDFGTFEGFNFRDQSAIERILSADEVLNWDHDKDGEAEFWPAGDSAGVALVFKGSTAVTAGELSALAALLHDLGGDTDENYLRVHYALNVTGESLDDLTAERVEDQPLTIFWGDSFTDARKEAAYELFELYYPELYKLWESTPCDGLIFDTDAFLDSPSWSVEEVRFNERAVLIVSSQ